MPAPDKIAFFKSGMGKFARQDFAGAIEEFNKALELDPAFADAHQSLAHCHERLGDLDAALQHAQLAVQHNPDDPLTHTSLSIFYQRQGLIPEAEREKAIALQLQRQTR